jgi:hypothetical protein
VFLNFPRMERRKMLKKLFKSAINYKRIAFIIFGGEMI